MRGAPGRLLTGAFVVAVLGAACGGSGGSAAPTTSGPTTTTVTGTPTTAQATSTTTGSESLSGFAAFGDFGGGTGQQPVANAIAKWRASGHRIDALVTTGDNVYPVGRPGDFIRQLRAPYRALHLPLWVTLGNHDVSAGYGDDQLRFLGLPSLPYAKRLPGAELLFVDANHPDAAQARWLDEHLSVAGPPFRIVVFHQPAYSCGPHGSTASVDRTWVPVLERHRVALVLNGHDHDYERFTSERGVTYVVTGGGGNGLYRLRSCSLPSGVTERAGAEAYHFVGVEIEGRRLSLTAVAADGRVLDRATISR